MISKKRKKPKKKYAQKAASWFTGRFQKIWG
jgi:hypothetical protein